MIKQKLLTHTNYLGMCILYLFLKYWLEVHSSRSVPNKLRDETGFYFESVWKLIFLTILIFENTLAEILLWGNEKINATNYNLSKYLKS